MWKVDMFHQRFQGSLSMIYQHLETFQYENQDTKQARQAKKKNKGQILWVLIPSPQTWSAVSTPKRHTLIKHPDKWMVLLLSAAVEAPLCLPTHLSMPSTLSWIAASFRSGLGESILLWLWLRLDLMTCFDVRKPAHVQFKVTLVRQDLPLCCCFFFLSFGIFIWMQL